MGKRFAVHKSIPCAFSTKPHYSPGSENKDWPHLQIRKPNHRVVTSTDFGDLQPITVTWGGVGSSQERRMPRAAGEVVVGNLRGEVTLPITERWDWNCSLGGQ